MKLPGHTNPEMTMRRVDGALTDLQREFQLAHSKPWHLFTQLKPTFASHRKGLDGVLDSLLAVHHALEIVRRSLPGGTSRTSLERLLNGLTKIVAAIRKLPTT
jgi:hypothetical protein